MLMNIMPPLAAAFLMTAWAAPAQTAASVCLPSDAACQNSFMTGPGAADLSQTIAAYTPPAGTKWASPTCRHVPCKLTDDDFIGPPLPPGFYDEQDREALAQARRAIGQNGVKDVIDLGDGRFATMRDDGTVGMCNRSQCEKPVPAGSLKDPKVDAWVASNNMTNGSSGGAAPKTGGSTPMMTDNTSPVLHNSARNLGAKFANDYAGLMRDFGTKSAPSRDDAADKLPKTGDDDAVVTNAFGAKAAWLSETPLTYIRLRENENTIRETNTAFNKGELPDFAAPNTPPPGTTGGPPVDPRYLGRTQAVENGGSRTMDLDPPRH